MSAISDVLYHRTLLYSLRGDINNTKIYFNILKSKFRDNEISWKDFTREQIDDLKKIKIQIETGKIVEVYDNFESYETEIKLTPTELEKEWEVVKMLCKNPVILEPYLGNGLKVRNIEFQISDINERCDVVFIDDEKIIYPTEVKLKKATHAIIGQIDKYYIYFKLDLIKNMYKKVKAVTIANSYSNYALNELMKKGIIVLAYEYTNNNIKVFQIKGRTQ